MDDLPGDLPSVGIRLLDDRLPGWGFPRWGSASAAGLDLHACLDTPFTLDPGGGATLIPAGFAVLIRDPAWCGLVFPRSGRGHREGLILGNGTGVIDADYEGPLMISAWNRASAPVRIEPGERIAQLVFTRIARPELTILDGQAGPGSGRGTGGFGSSGR